MKLKSGKLKTIKKCANDNYQSYELIKGFEIISVV